jgi:4-hydroxy-tetrahydrodipicolinate synthase
MTKFQPALVHTPVTPFTRENRINFGLLEKIIEFHLANGAGSLALPMHVGESVSLSDQDQRTLLEFTVKQVRERIPVIAHVSDSGTSIAASRARHAQEVGAAAIVATTPYYWTPPPSMLLEHFAQIGAAVHIPFLVFNSPEEMGGVKVGTDVVFKLIERLDNFTGIVDSSLDWQFMINVLSNARRLRPDFHLLSGTEYIVSAYAIGATGAFTSLAGIAPKLVRQLYDFCCQERYGDARKPQEEVAALRQIIKKAGIAGLKAAMRAMGRDCGEPRPPLQGLAKGTMKNLTEALGTMDALQAEPRSW